MREGTRVEAVLGLLGMREPWTPEVTIAGDDGEFITEVEIDGVRYHREPTVTVNRDLFHAHRDGFLAGERHAFEQGPSKSAEAFIAARAAAADYLDERERADEMEEEIKALKRRYDELTVPTDQQEADGE